MLIIECPRCHGSKTFYLLRRDLGPGMSEAIRCPACRGDGRMAALSLEETKRDDWTTRPRFSVLDVTIACGLVLVIIAWFVV